MASDEPSERPPWMPPVDEPPDGPPEWDQDEADWLVGKYALVGVTRMRADESSLVSQAQYHGKIISADGKNGIEIEYQGKRAGERMKLPPHLPAFRPADKGEYRLRSTGEVVADPDVIASWTITEPPKA
jgi:hypothetical protein